MNYFIEPHHTKKEVVFLQFAGLGDVLFIEPLYRHYHEKGYKVIAPVNDDIIWIQEYIPYVEFHKKSQFRYSYETVQQANDGRLHLPTRFSHPLLRGYDLHYGDARQFWMPDKYTFLGLPVEKWKELKFERNDERELSLYDMINLPQKYNFINNNFGGNFERVEIATSNGLPNVYMKKIEGFTMLDWGMVIEEAETIHTVETSLLYYVESLNFKGDKHLYPRYPWMDNCEYMNTILTDWIFHDKNDLA
jgi:hypothetical protein